MCWLCYHDYSYQLDCGLLLSGSSSVFYDQQVINDLCVTYDLCVTSTCRVPFPFLVLLVSGGHCLLAVARGVDDFLLLGRSLDIAPGDAFDKVRLTTQYSQNKLKRH